MTAPSDEEQWTEDQEVVGGLLEERRIQAPAALFDFEALSPLAWSQSPPILLLFGLAAVSNPLAGCAATYVLRDKMVAPQGASWETLSWFAALIAMATHLNKFGFIAWFSDKAGTLHQALSCGVITMTS